MSVSLTNLRARVRERADLTANQFVTDDANSVDAFINEAADTAYELFVRKYGADYFAKSDTSITTVAGTATYSLPTDFYFLYGVDLKANGKTQTLKTFRWDQRNRYDDTARDSFPSYRLEGAKIRFYPPPDGAYPVTLWYAPKRAALVAGSDTIDFPPLGDSLVVVDAAIRCLVKEERDIQALQLAKQELVASIEKGSANRDPGTPFGPVDVYEGAYALDPHAEPWE